MYGMVRRLQIIPMTRRFTAKERDTTLFDRIWETELPGIAAKAVRGWVRLQRRGRFKLPREMRAVRQEWLAHANPLRAFVAECIERDRNATAGYQAVYAAYQAYCQRSGITRVQQRLRVRRVLENIGFAVEHTRDGQVWRGMRLIHEDLNELG
jgi:phage/plasmid-associated DNA primase